MRLRKVEKPPEVIESPDYLRGYQDGLRDRAAATRHRSADGILGALLAIALLTGIGYCFYNYATTGRFFPEVEINNPLPPQE